MMRGLTFVVMYSSRLKVLVTAKPQPRSKARRIIAAVVVGGALARPNGFGNLCIGPTDAGRDWGTTDRTVC